MYRLLLALADRNRDRLLARSFGVKKGTSTVQVMADTRSGGSGWNLAGIPDRNGFSCLFIASRQNQSDHRNADQKDIIDNQGKKTSGYYNDEGKSCGADKLSHDIDIGNSISDRFKNQVFCRSLIAVITARDFISFSFFSCITTIFAFTYRRFYQSLSFKEADCFVRGPGNC